MKKSIAILLALIMTVSVFIGISISAKLAGDTNGDGETDNKGVVTLFRFVSGTTAGAVEGSCDFNGDGEINNKDVVALFRAVSTGEVPTIEEEETDEDTEEISEEESIEESSDESVEGSEEGSFDESSDEEPTEAGSIDVTESDADTEEEVPKEELDFIDFGDAPENITDFFTKAAYCEVSLKEDEDEGKVISITTKNILSSSSKPTVFFLYNSYSESQGKTAADFTEKPVVVLKVKALDVNDRMFSLIGSESDKSVKTTNETISKIPGKEGWHYVIFDFTEAKTPEKFKAFRINFEQTAGGNGETMLISEIRICTAEAAAEYAEADVFPIQEQTMEDYKLKVMQFNVQTENGNGAPISARSEMYRTLIEELQPDVVGMQEVTLQWRKWLDSCVFNDSYASVGEPRSTDASVGIEANPIYYRKDKFELVESGTFWLSDTPDVVGSMYEDSNYPRVCTWAMLRDRTTGAEFVHMNTHLDQNGASPNKETGNDRRKRQIGVIIKFAQRFDSDMPMFLTGDLNNRRTTSEGKTYALIKMIQGQTQYTDAEGNKYSIALSDTRLNAPGADTVNIATMTKYYDESNSAYNPSYEPIDYIFYNPKSSSALSYQTYLISKNNVWISDHLPLCATFQITQPED